MCGPAQVNAEFPSLKKDVWQNPKYLVTIDIVVPKNSIAIPINELRQFLMNGNSN